MKKFILILLGTFLFAQQNNFNKPVILNGITIFNLPTIKTNETNNSSLNEKNNTKIMSNKINNMFENNKTTKNINILQNNMYIKNNETNQSEINQTETNQTETNQTETNQTKHITYEEIFSSSFKTIKPKIDVAILINKKKFKKYLPSIINSINAYFIYKNSEYNLSVYDINQTSQALKHKNVIVFTYEPKTIYAFKDINNTNFYFPMINKNDVNYTQSNFYFGGINYTSQIKKLSNLIDENNTIAVNDNTFTSQKLFSIEANLFKTVIPYDWNKIYYKDLNNSYVFLNTIPQKTIQILSNIYYKGINPNLILSTQINYNPIIIALSQPQALTKLIIANSIINPPKELSDINLLLSSDIKFNWVNYSSNILCNKIYNLNSQGDIYFMNDFLLYIFNNQINYKTKLYQIVFNGFKEILTP